MACRCRKTVQDLQIRDGLLYGEDGLDLITCVADEAYEKVGDFTGYTYPFNKKRSLYVDSRDTVYVLGSDFMLES